MIYIHRHANKLPQGTHDLLSAELPLNKLKLSFMPPMEFSGNTAMT